MKHLHLLFLIGSLLCSLTACVMPSPQQPPFIPVLYNPAGDCPEPELKSNRETITEISYWYAREKDKGHTNFDPVLLSPEGFRRIPAPSTAPEPTWYVMKGPSQRLNTTIPVDLVWRCQPAKEPFNIKFEHLHRASGTRTGLTITEDASLPSGLRIEVTEFPE